MTREIMKETTCDDLKASMEMALSMSERDDVEGYAIVTLVLPPNGEEAYPMLAARVTPSEAESLCALFSETRPLVL